MLDLPLFDQPAIIVTASRSAETLFESPASATLIDSDRIDRIGSPLVADLLRLVPSVAVAVSGPAGSLTQVRIRGAEANHTLLFVDGIRANDPAAGNEPRFELLNADLASTIEVVRGPQSALWGSEAIGGVVAVRGAAPGSGGSQALVEGGSRNSWRGAARTEAGDHDRGISLGLAGQRSDGIDSFLGGGEKDGYDNVSLRGAGRYRVSPALLIGASGFAFKGQSEFDGFDAFYQRSDTRDETRNRLAAGRLFAEVGNRERSYANGSASLLGSANRNFVDDDPVNETEATRRLVALEGGHRLGRHQFVVAVESERETFEARDTAFGGFTDQDRSRSNHSLTGEWRATGLGPISAGLALRHDIFSRFRDATTFRAGLKVALGGDWSMAANYGEGIAQPTFFDLYGFFPGSFSGNPKLRPESSVGGEVALRYAAPRTGASLTLYRHRLKDEIVTVFLPDFTSTALNADRKSTRQGIEIEAFYRATESVRLSFGYAFLDAEEPRTSGGQSREPRRPRHSGSVAVDGTSGRISYGAAVAFTGARTDTDFDSFPARSVRLHPNWLVSARAAYRLTDTLEAHVRITNALDQTYQDVIGYRTEGRSIHAGFRIAVDR